MFGFSMFGRRGRGKTRRGNKGAARRGGFPASNWFAGLTMPECKAMLKAIGEPVSGSKADVVGRLTNHGDTEEYANVARAGGPTLAELKDDCRREGLSQSGKKAELVLRLLQASHGNGAPKRAANVVLGDNGKPLKDASGHVVMKQRKPSTKDPNVPALRERLRKKIYVSHKVQWKWSNYTSKMHCDRAVTCASSILRGHVIERGCHLRGRLAAAATVTMVLEEITTGVNKYNMRGMGRVDDIGAFGRQVNTITQGLAAAFEGSDEGAASAARLHAAITAFIACASEYGQGPYVPALREAAKVVAPDSVAPRTPAATSTLLSGASGAGAGSGSGSATGAGVARAVAKSNPTLLAVPAGSPASALPRPLDTSALPRPLETVGATLRAATHTSIAGNAAAAITTPAASPA